MLCLPGLTPVAKLDHATGDSDGCVVSSLRKVPASASFLRFGSLPSSMYFFESVGSIPSKPITNTLRAALRAGLPAGALLQAGARTASTASAATIRRAFEDEIIQDTSQKVRNGSAILRGGSGSAGNVA